MTRTYDQCRPHERQRQQQAAEERSDREPHSWCVSRRRGRAASRGQAGVPNPGGRREFDTDWRQGDRICRHCGCVQNTRSVESHEEEKRTFADDDNKEAKKRAEKSTGRGGGSVGQSNLAQAHTRALEGGDLGEGEMSTRDLHRIEAYRGKLSGLADALQLSKAIEQEGAALCEVFVRKQLEHDGRCQAAASGATCRLSWRPSAALVAAAVLKEAMRKHDGPAVRGAQGGAEERGHGRGRRKKIGRRRHVARSRRRQDRRPADADDEGLEGGRRGGGGAAEGGAAAAAAAAAAAHGGRGRRQRVRAARRRRGGPGVGAAAAAAAAAAQHPSAALARACATTSACPTLSTCARRR